MPPGSAFPDLDRLLRPRSVAVVGATDRPGSYAGHVLRNLRRAGFDGAVHGVHPSRTEVLGVPVVRSLDDLPGPADAVVVATPAASVAGYLTDAARLGCGGAVVIAAGFAEAGEAAGQAALAHAAGAMPVLGPNANGLVAVDARAPLWGDAVELPAEAGGIALVTQSGNLGVTALAHRGGTGLHTVLSLGNAAMVDAAGAVAALAARPGVRALALYLEDDGDGARLAAALAACARQDVRVVVLKAGRSPAGRAAGSAHTAALAGDQRVFAALVTEAGGVLAVDPLDLLETARALAAGRRHRGGVAVLTCSGGDAALSADLAADAGVPLPVPGPDAVRGLRALLPVGATPANPLDITNALWAQRDGVAAVAAALTSDPAVGHLLVVQDQPPRLAASDAAEWALTRDGAADGASSAGVPALLAATTPGQEPVGAVAGLRPALAALAALRRPAPDPARLEAIAAACGQFSAQIAGSSPGSDRASVPGGRALAEHEAKRLLAGCGVPVPPGRTASTAAEAVAAARAVGYPVALKASATGLVHASDAGGLALDLPDAAAVRAAAGRLLAAVPGAALLVESMVQAEAELIVAVRTDAVVPCLLLGLGGIWAEALDDVTVLPLPVDEGAVHAALARLRAAPLLLGGRGRSALAVDALARLAVAAAHACAEHHLALLELNPVRLSRAAAVAVDAVVVPAALDAGTAADLRFLNGQSG